MQTKKTRLMAITGATLALALVGTAAVSAAPGDRGDQRGFGKDRGGEQFQRGERGGQGHFGQRGNRGGPRAGIRQGIGERLDGLVRRESTLQTDDGIVTKRVDNGTATSASDSGLDYTLATGESASVSTDEDTQVVAFSLESFEGRRGQSRERMVPAEIALADIESGAEVVVWADSQDDGTFLAQRIVVQPDVEEADAAAEATEEAAAIDADATAA